jgi:hypothetical protein
MPIRRHRMTETTQPIRVPASCRSSLGREKAHRVTVEAKGESIRGAPSHSSGTRSRTRRQGAMRWRRPPTIPRVAGDGFSRGCRLFERGGCVRARRGGGVVLGGMLMLASRDGCRRRRRGWPRWRSGRGAPRRPPRRKSKSG